MIGMAAQERLETALGARVTALAPCRSGSA